MTDDADYPELTETVVPYGVAKTSPELADELYLAPRANMKGRATSTQATALVSFLDEAYPRPTKAGTKAPYRAGIKRTLERRQAIAALLAELLIAAVALTRMAPQMTPQSHPAHVFGLWRDRCALET